MLRDMLFVLTANNNIMKFIINIKFIASYSCSNCGISFNIVWWCWERIFRVGHNLDYLLGGARYTVTQALSRSSCACARVVPFRKTDISRLSTAWCD